MTDLDLTAIADRNKSNYLQAKDAFNRNEIDLCISFYSPSHQVMSTPSPNGRAVIRSFLEESRRTWPDIKIVVEHAVAQGNWVMGRSVTTATHTEVVMGVMPTNKQIQSTFWDLHRFDENGLIVETWNLRDTMAILSQLGIFPSPR